MTLYKGQEEAFDSCLKQSNELDIKCTDMDDNTIAIFPLNFLCYQEIYIPGKFCYLLTSICKTSGLIDKFISWITGTFKRSFGVDAVLTTLSWGITLIVI